MGLYGKLSEGVNPPLTLNRQERWISQMEIGRKGRATKLASILEEADRIRWEGLTRKQLGYVLIIPALIVIVCISVFPFITTVAYSFHTMKLNMPHLGRPFAGFKNYIHLLNSSRFINSFKITLFFASVVVVAQLLFGLAIALVINKRFKGRGIVRATVLAPWATALVIAAMLWRWMYNAVFGIINSLFLLLGAIDKPVDWLGASTPLAISSVIVAELWRNTPFMAIIILAGLQSIPEELYEAARIDGAGVFESFRKITLPLLKPAILVALLFRSIDAFRGFDLVYALTAGGPGNSTELASLYSYRLLFKYLDFGRGSAATLLMAIFTTVLCLVYIRLISVEEY